LVKERVFEISKDPTKSDKLPVAKDPVPYLDFSRLDNALVALKAEAQNFKVLSGKAANLPADRRAALNGILYKAERSLLQEQGLPRRPWYRHQIYAPGFYTGYGVKTLPGVREGIEQRNWPEAQSHIELLAKTLENYTAEVRKATSLLK
jgi:N-acetylated-alpha-linked acidic dipeptidase